MSAEQTVAGEIQEFARLVARMRHAQREYFRTRSGHALELAKAAEKKVDRQAEQILSPQTRLW